MTYFLKYFNEGIRQKEPQISNLKLRAGNGLVYVQPKKNGTVFLRASAVCTQCLSQNTSKGKYSITIKEHPFHPTTKEELIDYVRVFIEHDTHAHPVLENNTDDQDSDDDLLATDVPKDTQEIKNYDIHPKFLLGEERDQVNYLFY